MAAGIAQWVKQVNHRLMQRLGIDSDLRSLSAFPLTALSPSFSVFSPVRIHT